MPRKQNKSIVSAPNKPIVPATIERPSFGQVMKEGIAFGVGQSIAHRILGMAISTTNNTTPSVTPVTRIETPEYIQCMKESSNDKDFCKQYL